MKIIKPIILLFIITFSFESYSQDNTRIVSNIQDLVLDVDESFTASSVTMDDNDNEVSCNNMIYYSRNREALDVNNETGEITANSPGFFTVVAICIQEGGKRLRKDFSVKVMNVSDELKEIDATGHFEADDEIGTIFTGIQEINKDLQETLGEEVDAT